MSKKIILAQKQVSPKPNFSFKKTYLKQSSLICLLAFSNFSWADTSNTTPSTLNTLIDKVQRYQNSQNVWNNQDDIAKLNIKNAKVWDNPSLSVQQTGFDSKSDKELSISVSQRLDLFGERKAQKNIAEISQQQIHLKQQIYSTKLNLIVKYAWSQFAIASLEKSVIEAQLQLSQESLNAVQNRYLAGGISQLDVDRVRMLYMENQRLATQSELQLELAKQQLSHLWGESDSALNMSLTAENLWPKNIETQVTENLSNNLFKQSLQMDVSLAQANIDFLKAQARPNPSLSLGVNQVKSPQVATDNQLLLGIEIPLNIFNRNQYSIQIAKAQQDALTRQQQFYAQQNQLSLQSLLTEISGFEKQFQQIESNQIPLAAQIQNRLLIGFRAGKFSISDVQQAMQQIQDIRLRKVQLLREGWQRAVEVESLSIGVPSSEITAKDAIANINQNAWSDLQSLPVIGGRN